MMSRRSGFTLAEMLFVVIIGGMVLAMGTREYTSLGHQRATSNAGNALVHTANRARSEAMRTGEVVYMWVRPDLGLVSVGTTLDTIHTLDAGDYEAAMIGNSFRICYAARGYALPGCTNVATTQLVGFVRGMDTAWVQVLPLGQARRTQ